MDLTAGANKNSQLQESDATDVAKKSDHLLAVLMTDVTQILSQIEQGDLSAAEQLTPTSMTNCGSRLPNDFMSKNRHSLEVSAEAVHPHD